MNLEIMTTKEEGKGQKKKAILIFLNIIITTIDDVINFI